MSEASSELRSTAVWLIGAGALIVIRASIELADPVYWAPTSLLDYAAVVLTTLAWVAAGWAFISWSRSTSIRRCALPLLLAGIGTLVSGIGNLLEDLFDLEFGGLLYSWGGITGALSALLAAALMLPARHPLRWAAFVLIGFVAGSFFPDAGGEFLSGLSLLSGGLWLFLSQESRASIAAPTT